jgi:hypothetical protein
LSIEATSISNKEKYFSAPPLNLEQKHAILKKEQEVGDSESIFIRPITLSLKNPSHCGWGFSCLA